MPTGNKMLRIGDVNTDPAPYVTEADLVDARKNDAAFTDADMAVFWCAAGAD